MDDLIKREKDLHSEGEQVLEKLQILNILSRFGSPKTVGSFATGLMVWRDLDIVLEKEIDEKGYWETVNLLFYSPRLKYLTLTDFRNSTNPNTPKGLYLGIKYWFENKEWKIDVWFIAPRAPGSENFNEWIKEKLDEKSRRIILGIKSKIYNNPDYKKKIYSVDIYKAVINEGIVDLGGFRKYLAKSGRSI
ncbi:MAG: hypothetical protein A2186_01695 [Candidatus Levybacteria bacterium RIFOXYA1_FULL_41_10]|nr:MAG: hypothetical protein UT44_C0023G0023 [Candidatus Levybacteria bacterium GW2011_GWA1_39_32]KKR51524.1 MAG: hypothetical protein UT87_C0005G0060 [Candidatus Levybacteria bacterium GW2011_GWC1_40_19]KKR95412.1 MAG: hypothetical protein UU45_C0001G0007 [Candidatus Levybacteria bacterium GW2011_GWA2_41_15]KKS01897.1 MAG: hypothetical protein UU52_C0005G0006 [Candidatus Levybacteria bacterium GW2011_GWB1_41_21]OGH20901.1 MAG: hypothetical protein A2695_02825 [Candidatus Levybacteria bacterium